MLRRGISPRAAWVCGAIVISMSPSLARAYQCKVSESYDYVSLSWQQREIKYGVRAPGSSSLPDGATVLRAIDESFAAWTLPDCTDLRFQGLGVVNETAPREVSQVVFVQNGWRYAMDAVALTRTTYGVEDGIIRAATIEVNEEHYKFRDVIADGCVEQPPSYDITAVLTHEVGHLIGLDHTRNFSHQPTDPTMAPEVEVCEVDKRTLEQDDIDGLCLLYPRGEPPGHCLPLPPAGGPQYVSNTPFGCTAVDGTRDAPFWAFAVLAVALLRSRRRPKTCPEVLSG